jgi:hypothetical protein
MTKMATAAVAAILLSGPALGEPETIRAKLLGTPTWAFEQGRAGNIHNGKAWFAEKDGKLIGYIEAGFKCDSEVTLQADGFDMETCAGSVPLWHFANGNDGVQSRLAWTFNSHEIQGRRGCTYLQRGSLPLLAYRSDLRLTLAGVEGGDNGQASK